MHDTPRQPGTESSDEWLDLDPEPLEQAVKLLELDDLLEESEPALRELAEQTPYGEIVLSDLIRRQLTLGLSVATVFLMMLFGLPIFNLLFPELAALPIFGLPLTWLLLAVLVYPLLWLLALYYATTSRKFEEEFVELVR